MRRQQGDGTVERRDRISEGDKLYTRSEFALKVLMEEGTLIDAEGIEGRQKEAKLVIRCKPTDLRDYMQPGLPARDQLLRVLRQGVPNLFHFPTGSAAESEFPGMCASLNGTGIFNSGLLYGQALPCESGAFCLFGEVTVLLPTREDAMFYVAVPAYPLYSPSKILPDYWLRVPADSIQLGHSLFPTIQSILDRIAGK